jgi:hypothetical protein
MALKGEAACAALRGSNNEFDKTSRWLLSVLVKRHSSLSPELSLRKVLRATTSRSIFKTRPPVTDVFAAFSPE